MFIELLGLGADVANAAHDRDAESDPGPLWKLGQVMLVILGAVATCVVLAYVGRLG